MKLVLGPDFPRAPPKGEKHRSALLPSCLPQQHPQQHDTEQEVTLCAQQPEGQL
jgi:hypothetical protein